MPFRVNNYYVVGNCTTAAAASIRFHLKYSYTCNTLLRGFRATPIHDPCHLLGAHVAQVENHWFTQTNPPGISLFVFTVFIAGQK